MDLTSCYWAFAALHRYCFLDMDVERMGFRVLGGTDQGSSMPVKTVVCTRSGGAPKAKDIGRLGYDACRM